MTLYDLAVSVIGAVAVVCAVVAARKMTPERVRYLDRVPFGRRDKEPESEHMSIARPSAEILSAELWPEDFPQGSPSLISLYGDAWSEKDVLEGSLDMSDSSFSEILEGKEEDLTDRTGQRIVLVSISEQAKEIKRSKHAIDELEKRMRKLEEQSQRTWEKETEKRLQQSARTAFVN